MEKPLGPLRQVCLMSRRFYFSRWLLVLFDAAVASGFAYALWLQEPSSIKPNDHRAAVILCFLAGFICAYFLYDLWIHRGAHVEFYEEGLVTQLYGQRHHLGWDDIDSLRVKITEQNVNGIHATTLREYFLLSKEGASIIIPSGLQNVSEAGETMEKEVYPRVRARYAQTLQRGEAVAFGSWKMDPQGLHIQGEQRAWSVLQEVNLLKGVIAVKEKSGKVWRSQAYGEIPNAPVFLQLAQGFLSGT